MNALSNLLEGKGEIRHLLDRVELTSRATGRTMSLIRCAPPGSIILFWTLDEARNAGFEAVRRDVANTFDTKDGSLVLPMHPRSFRPKQVFLRPWMPVDRLFGLQVGTPILLDHHLVERLLRQQSDAVAVLAESLEREQARVEELRAANRRLGLALKQATGSEEP